MLKENVKNVKPIFLSRAIFFIKKYQKKVSSSKSLEILAVNHDFWQSRKKSIG
jgi:hypothetical protein